MNQSLRVKAKRGSENTIKKQGFRLPQKKGDSGAAESWTQKVVPLVNFKSIFGCMGSDELMISSIRPFSSYRFILFDLESLNENNLRIEDLGIENILLEHYTTNLMESLVLLND